MFNYRCRIKANIKPMIQSIDLHGFYFDAVRSPSQAFRAGLGRPRRLASPSRENIRDGPRRTGQAPASAFTTLRWKLWSSPLATKPDSALTCRNSGGMGRSLARGVGPPATATAELLELVDIGQHLGHGGEEPLGDLLANLGGVVDGPGQWRRGHHGDVVPRALSPGSSWPPSSTPWPAPWAPPPGLPASYFRPPSSGSGW